MGQQIDDQEAHGQDGSHGDAQNGTCRGNIQPHAQLQEVPGQRQAQKQLAQRLQDLRHGGGRHVPLALGIAPHAGQQTHAEHRGRQGLNGPVAQGLIHKVRQLGSAEVHEQCTYQTQRKEQPDGGAENLPLLIFPPLGVSLTGELGDGQRQTGGGDGQQHVIDIVGNVEIRLPLAADDVAEGNLIDSTDDLHDGDSRRQNGGTAQKGLLFLIRHEEVTSK